MKSIKISIAVLLFISVMLRTTFVAAQGENHQESNKLDETILHLDSLFWQAYNTCDIEKMEFFLTEDLEFYHDKGGLTTTRAKLIESTKNGICSKTEWRLRREAVAGTVKVFPINNYGALLSGEHLFYINETGKKERLDGLAKFMHVWQFKNNEWKMSRVLSYDHGPAPYTNKHKEISLSAAQLKQFTGNYTSEKFGTINIKQEGAFLKLIVGDFHPALYAASPNLFFIKERDLQFEFVTENNKITKMIVYENGNVVDEVKKFE